jgi:hypothetical protein
LYGSCASAGFVASYRLSSDAGSSHRAELDAYVTKRSMARTSYLPTRALTGHEDVSASVGVAAASGFSRNVSQLALTEPGRRAAPSAFTAPAALSLSLARSSLTRVQ